MRYNGLFATTLDDGRGLDEALAPGDFVDTDLGHLYQRVYDTLAEGGGLTPASMLADLAAQGEMRLSATLAQAVLELPETETEAPSADPPSTTPPADLMETWNAALQTILLRHQEQRYEQDRRALNAGTSQDPRKPSERNRPGPPCPAAGGVPAQTPVARSHAPSPPLNLSLIHI